ncbi:hypothetical protein [Acidisphaera sp. S103]|uniref:hypothetical protein n=1 Tax=Acidisphaera sp. S103 TaxID=1747223 RepID=UPI00131C6FF5|nr:hypothetical protein [Acidisphaera sp. S103]
MSTTVPPPYPDNTLLSIAAPTAFGQTLSYLIQGGQKRRIYDTQTLSLLATLYGQPKPITTAVAAIIPSGPDFPSRADGTVYQGAPATYAYLLKGGLKSAVPDATTLRDSGHDPSTALAIAAADLAAIPDGPALPSTSKFLHPPPSSVPLLLLPMRIETRYQNNDTELWIRIFPDDVHVNSFEPELTAEETSARAAFLAAAANGGQAAQDGFTALAQQFGPARAAWIARADAQSGTKPGSWTTAPSTNLLPERWLVMGYIGTIGHLLAVGPAIPDSLALGPDPNGPGPATDTGMAWLTNFDRAVAAGMGFRITITPTLGVVPGFDRIAVFGLNTQITPKESVQRFGEVLQAHHYTDGLELLPHGAPTNNTDDTSSTLNSHDPNYARLYALEQGPALCPARPTADGDRLARGIGFDPALLAHISGANGGQDEHAAAMNTVLWPATLGYYLEQIVSGSIPTPDVLLPLARDHFSTHVRARGHFPILRVGTQPYGVLPVMWNAQWKELENRALDTPLMSLLANLRTTWESSVANVPKVPGAADPEAALVSVLGMEPRSVAYSARSAIGPEYNLTYWRFLQKDPGATWWSNLSEKVVAEAGPIATAVASTRLAITAFVSQLRRLTDDVVAPAPPDGVGKPDYVAHLLGTHGWQDLRNYILPAQPVPLLLLLLRHAALRQYVDTAAELLAQQNAIQPSERIEPELIGLSVGVARPTPWDILGRPIPSKGAVGTLLDSSRTDPTIPGFSGFWSAFTTLSTLSAEVLDATTREAMDLASYRLDAWFTSMAHYRLDQLRTTAPTAGVILGAYGWVENVRPQAAVASSGYIHAPSLAHATTAAVLRSAYLTHKPAATGPQSPLEITLTSSRVRLGLSLLDGVRQGQPLGALLGYRLERSLHDAGLETLIQPLRTIAPLNDTPDTSTTTAESVPANNVVDGLALLAAIFPNGTLATGMGLPSDAATRGKLTQALQTLTDAIDATADLTLAESVHQLLRGNPVRGGATLDAIARGDAPPPELDVIETPRAGTAFTHRLFAVAGGVAASGWAATPRAQAEPRLNAWASSILPAPANIRAQATFTDSTSAVLATVDISMADAGIAPLDLLALPEASAIGGELAARLLRAAARPATVPATAGVALLGTRASAWPATIVSVTELLQLLVLLNRLLASVRALTPQDLVFPGGTPGGIDNAELQSRADAAEALLRAASAPLQGSSGLDSALLAAANLGLGTAVPALDSSQWPAQAAAAITGLNARIAALNTLAAGFTRTGASTDAQRDFDVARLNTVFGQSFLVLPTLDATLAAQWPQLWSNSLALQSGDALASLTWLQRLARIRPSVARFYRSMLSAEALAGSSLPPPEVAQLPFASGDLWAALPQSAPAAASSKLSLVAFATQAYAAGSPITGLAIDEWVDVLPTPQQITGISFHQDDPTARAPQSILLAVPPDSFPEWTLESLEGTILEALDLAKIRAVDPDALTNLGHCLPALYFAYNAGAAAPEAVSTDFNLARFTGVSKAR